MNIGFVYILLNPAFPKQLKIGRTDRDSRRRARELSRQTGVPNEFIVIYDELVCDARQVEAIVHARLDGYRVSRTKEFFVVPPKEAIRVLQEVASGFPFRQVARDSLLTYFHISFQPSRPTWIRELSHPFRTASRRLLPGSRSTDGGEGTPVDQR